MVEWAPQEEILNHSSIGGFLTHSGWNSTLESIVAGVPMICWSYFADQTINSRFVSEVWKLGLDMKDTCDRNIIEMMVRDMMEVRKNEFLQSADRMAKLARNAVREGGSSYYNLDHLIEYIKLMVV
ncbi:7-deoxyloganetic acid glucosyl transferase [Sarracenia purpurea var. burkii]